MPVQALYQAIGLWVVHGCAVELGTVQVAEGCPHVNCVPRSEVMSLGTPYLEIHPSRADAQELTSIDVSRKASGHWVNLSTTVKR